MINRSFRIFTAGAIAAVVFSIAACGGSKQAENGTNKAAGNSNSDFKASSGKLSGPVKFLLAGDSLMREGFGPAVETSLLTYKDVSVLREGVYSTGLNKTDFFDWAKRTEELLEQNKSDVLVVSFGANDGQGILDDNGKAFDLGTAGWSEVYAQRVNRYLTRISPKVKKIFWVGHPIPGSDKFVKKFMAMNPIYKVEAAKFPNVIYVDTWDSLAVNGVYQRSLKDESGKTQVARQGDGVHVTNFGGKIMAVPVIKAILEVVDLKQ